MRSLLFFDVVCYVQLCISEFLNQKTTADSCVITHFFIYLLRGTDQGVKSVHDFFYTRNFSTPYFGENMQYLNDIYMQLSLIRHFGPGSMYIHVYYYLSFKLIFFVLKENKS